MHAIALFGIASLWTPVARAESARAAADTVIESFAEFEKPPGLFLSDRARLTTQLGEGHVPVELDDAAHIHAAIGLTHWLQGTYEDPTGALQRAACLGYRFPEGIVPAGHPLREHEETAALETCAALPDEPIAAPAGWTLRCDGREGCRADGLPAIAQAAPAGEPLRTRYFEDPTGITAWLAELATPPPAPTVPPPPVSSPPSRDLLDRLPGLQAHPVPAGTSAFAFVASCIVHLASWDLHGSLPEGDRSSATVVLVGSGTLGLLSAITIASISLDLPSARDGSEPADPPPPTPEY